jgi:hypothetical protein
MPETETLVTETKQEEKKPVVASMGKVQRANMNGNNGNAITDNNTTQTSNENTDTKVDTKVETKAEVPIEFTPEQKKEFFKQLGVDYKGDEDIEQIKEKLKPTVALPSEEEKKKAENDKELRLVELFVKNGGTVDQFNAIKQIANADQKEFSKKEAIAEFMEAGFTEDEAKVMAKERYYQIQLDEITQDLDNEESDEDFEKRKKALQKKIDFGSKKLEQKSSYKIQQAAAILNSLQDAIKSEETEVKNEAKLSSNVDEMLKNLPRKVTYELGKVNDQTIAPIEHEYSEESIAKVAAFLKDKAQRNNFFYNQDNSLNIQNLTKVLLNNFEQERIVKNALLEGQTRQVAIFESVFTSKTGYQLGVGGSPNKNISTGKVASFGKVQKVSPQHN